MNDLISPVQEALSGLVPLLLLVPGAILVLAGLFYWLGGLRFLKPLAVMALAAAGFGCAWLFTDRQLITVLCCTLIPAVFGLFLEKPVVVVMGAALAAGGMLGWTLATNAPLRQAVCQRVGALPKPQDASVSGGVRYAQELNTWSAAWLKTYWLELPASRKAAAAAAAGVVLMIGLAAWRWVCALTCAALGTAWLVGGMFLILLSKGEQAVSLFGRVPYPAAVAGGMVLLGTLVNRWLCPPKKKKKTSAENQPVPGDKK